MVLRKPIDGVGDSEEIIEELWDSEDGFFYDLLRLPNGGAMRLKIRPMVGLLSLWSSSVLEAVDTLLLRHPWLRGLIELLKKRHSEAMKHIAPPMTPLLRYEGRRLWSVCDKNEIESSLAYMLDESEFLSPHGLRSLFKCHLEHSCVFNPSKHECQVQYLPAESNTGMFGDNSNWRGPI